MFPYLINVVVFVKYFEISLGHTAKYAITNSEDDINILSAREMQYLMYQETFKIY